MAAKYGCQQAFWLHGPDEEITEAGAMNIFILFHHENGKMELVTPQLESCLMLPGIVRQSILEIAREAKELHISDRKVTIKEVLNGAENGTLVEMFCTGTASFVTPVGKIYYDGVIHSLPLPESNKLFSQRYGSIHALHRGAFCQFPFRWIYYYGSNKPTGKETGKMHLSALHCVAYV